MNTSALACMDQQDIRCSSHHSAVDNLKDR